MKLPTYIGVSDKLVCTGCGCEVINRAMHDNFHGVTLQRIAELERQVDLLKRDLMAHNRAHELVTV